MAEVLESLEEEHKDIAGLFAEVSDPNTDHRNTLGDLIRRLAAHISVEHSVFYPKVKRAGSTGQRLGRGLRRDYKYMERLLTRIERRKVNSPDLPAMVTDLQDRFEAHVRRCRAMAPRAASELSPEDLHDMSERMAAAEGVILSHPHPHMLSLGPLSRLTTRLAARFDRARDRTVTNLP